MIKTHAFRLKPGADLKKEIEAYVKTNHIKAGWISTCAGSLTDYNIRFVNKPEGSNGKGHFRLLVKEPPLVVQNLLNQLMMHQPK